MGYALGPADRTFFVLHVFMLVGVVWLGALCIVSEIVWTKCNTGGKWISSGFYQTRSDDSTISSKKYRKEEIF